MIREVSVNLERWNKSTICRIVLRIWCLTKTVNFSCSDYHRKVHVKDVLGDELCRGAVGVMCCFKDSSVEEYGKYLKISKLWKSL